MAHQTSKNSRKQTTPPIIGRLMDADVLRFRFRSTASGCIGPEQYLCRCVVRKGSFGWYRPEEVPCQPHDPCSQS